MDTLLVSEKVKRIWMDILDNDNIDEKVNFYELGGHSLLVANMISELEEAFNIEIDQIDFMLDLSTLENCIEYISKIA